MSGRIDVKGTSGQVRKMLEGHHVRSGWMSIGRQVELSFNCQNLNHFHLHHHLKVLIELHYLLRSLTKFSWDYVTFNKPDFSQC